MKTSQYLSNFSDTFEMKTIIYFLVIFFESPHGDHNGLHKVFRDIIISMLEKVFVNALE